MMHTTTKKKIMSMIKKRDRTVKKQVVIFVFDIQTEEYFRISCDEMIFNGDLIFGMLHNGLFHWIEPFTFSEEVTY